MRTPTLAPSTISETFPGTGLTTAVPLLVERGVLLAAKCRSHLRDRDLDEAREHYVLLVRVLRALSALPFTPSRDLDALRAERDELAALLALASSD